MKPLTEKVLKSGLVDKHMALMLEKWGNLPEGSAELVKDVDFQKVTREQLAQLGEELGDEVEKLRTLKETQLDLEQMRWPTAVTLEGDFEVPAVIDRMGRLYFRVQDVKEEWLIPGHHTERQVLDKELGRKVVIKEQILESSMLYTDEVPVCFQVTVHRVA